MSHARPPRFSARRYGLMALLSFLGALTVVAVMQVGREELQAELTKPQASDHHVTKLVTLLLKREHLSKHELDDEISQRALRGFLKRLDSMKLYFLQSDVDEFVRKRDQIDDMLKEGDITFGYTIFNRFLKRVDERVKMVDKLLAPDQQFDFTQDEAMVVKRDQARYATSDEEAYDRWRKRIKYDLLVLKADKEDSITGEKAREKLRRRYHSFAKRMHQTDSDELLEMFLTSMTTSFDPHTTYMSASSLDNFYIMMRLNLEGIGAALSMQDGYTEITKIIPGGAADKHGKLEVKDRIISVGEGVDGEMVDVVDMKLSEVVKRIRGKADTIVRLGVKKKGIGKTVIYNIRRAKVELKDSEARSVVFDAGKKPGGTAYKVGVIDLPSFYMDMNAARAGKRDFKSTTRDVKKILDDFKMKSVDAVILDLRRNGGGSLTEAINLTGLFIDRGPVVQVKDSDGRIEKYEDLAPGMSWDGPLVVLTSKFSASASEIFAGAIKDYDRGIVVGDETTHGKGTVQSLLDLGSQLFRIKNAPNLGALKITMQQFYRPNGASTQNRGVRSDIVLPAITNHMDIAESDLDYAVAFDKVPSAEFDQYNMRSGEMIKYLAARSKERLKRDAKFIKVLKDIERYRTQKSRTYVSLNEEKFLKEREELDADKEEEKQFRDEDEDEDVIVERDYYFEEVLRITVDYLNLVKDIKIAAN